MDAKHILNFRRHLIKNGQACIIKGGRTQPKQLANFAARTMADESLQNLDEELADLLHDAMDFEDNPSVILLNQMEKRTRKIEKRLP